MKGHAFLRTQEYVLLVFLISEVRKEVHFTDRMLRARKLGDRAAGHVSYSRVIEISHHILKG